MMLVALELYYNVYYMFKYLWTGNGTVFCYVTNENDRHVVLFGKLQQHGRALTHLRHAPRGGIDRFAAHCLYGIDNKQFRRNILYMCEHSLERCLAYYVTIATLMCYAVGTQFYLLNALFARHIQHLAVRQSKDCLQHKCRFSNAGFATQQH